jgi:hypothetical protein
MSTMERSDNMLEPLPYHLELRDYLMSKERELWNWFASAQAKADYTENLRLELLKSTCRLDAGSHPELYQHLEDAKARLQLDIPVTLYQAQHNPQPCWHSAKRAVASCILRSPHSGQAGRGPKAFAKAASPLVCRRASRPLPPGLASIFGRTFTSPAGARISW